MSLSSYYPKPTNQPNDWTSFMDHPKVNLSLSYFWPHKVQDPHFCRDAHFRDNTYTGNPRSPFNTLIWSTVDSLRTMEFPVWKRNNWKLAFCYLQTSSIHHSKFHTRLCGHVDQELLGLIKKIFSSIKLVNIKKFMEELWKKKTFHIIHFHVKTAPPTRRSLL